MQAAISPGTWALSHNSQDHEHEVTLWPHVGTRVEEFPRLFRVADREMPRRKAEDENIT